MKFETRAKNGVVYGAKFTENPFLTIREMVQAAQATVGAQITHCHMVVAVDDNGEPHILHGEVGAATIALDSGEVVSFDDPAFGFYTLALDADHG